MHRLRILTVLVFATSAEAASELPLIPDVRKAELRTDRLPARWTPMPSGHNGFQSEISMLGMAADAPGLPLRLAVDGSTVTTPEGYRLDIRRDGVTLTGADDAGVFYGLKTLRQLVALHPEGVSCGVIEDAPAFRVRGFMHDTGRNFQSVESLKSQIDRFADYKLNVFHWHLTDRPGWRIECKSHPVLNDPKTRMKERDPDGTYSYVQIREVIAHAKARHVRVIPELDMPGHSDYFKKAFGFEMGDPQALPILKDLIAEFCAEIPAADCPILHIGSDEVHIRNPKDFITAISTEVRRHGRIPMMWNPGLPNDGSLIEQIWRDTGSKDVAKSGNAGIVDSGLGYINKYEPALSVRRYFFLQSCGVSTGDDKRLGGILCCWPDIRVEDKSKIPMQNGVWPSTLALAQNTWHGRAKSDPHAAVALPAPDSASGREYAKFEDRLALHRDTFFQDADFPFVKSARMAWRIAGPFAADSAEGKDASAVTTWHPAFGGVIPTNFHLPQKAGKTLGIAYALTYAYTEKPHALRVQVGFETPSRSNRHYAGIPHSGTWDANGGAIWVNDTLAPAPTWKHPGTRRIMHPTWGTPEELIAIDDEELYWTREPATLALKAGWNKILVRLPAGHAARDPWFAFFPVKQETSGRWIEDSSVSFAANPGGSR